jgi:predicted deacylase
MAEIESGAISIVAGTVSFVPVCNPLAYRYNARVGDRNLNRGLTPTTEPKEFEDHVANWLCPLLAQHEVLLDLHSFRGPGDAFALIGPENNNGDLEPFQHAELERALAARLGVGRVVDGWLGTYAQGVARRRERLTRAGVPAGDPDWKNADARYGVGTTEYMRSTGGAALTLECGQHEDPHAPEVAYRAILSTLAYLRVIAAPAPAGAATIEGLSIYDVVDKAFDDDKFSRIWVSFDLVSQGDLIGVRGDGTEVRADEDGRIIFPDENSAAGEEWFYLTRPNQRF